MATTLAEIREKLAAMENRGNNNSNNSGGDGAIYPFWNMDEGSTTVLRFLPDDDPNNVFFWVERQMIRLSFPGVKGQDESKPVTIQVPCGEMYGDTCPVLTQVRPWFSDASLEDMARKYWKKRSYIFQGFVVDDPMNEDNKPENPIRRFVIGPQIFNIIKSALMDPDMENVPTDYTTGTDFRLSKTTKGQYADYSTSKWARRERSLNEDELAAIDTHGLTDLKQFLPTRPTQEHYRAIEKMFEASVNGELYDVEKWGNFYKPYGVEVPQNAAPAGASAPVTVAPAPKPASTKPAPAVTEQAPAAPQDSVEEAAPAAPANTASSAEGKPKAEEILAMIRNRNA